MTTIAAPPNTSLNRDIAARVLAKTLPHVREKYRKNVAIQSRNKAAHQAYYDHVNSLVKKRAEVELNLAQARRTFENGSYQGASGEWRERIAELEKERAEITEEIDETQREMAKIQSAFPIGKIDAWLAAVAGQRLKRANPSVPKGDPIAALEKVRAQLRDISNAIQEAQTARLPPKEALDRAIAEIDHMASKGRPYFARTRIVEPNNRGGFKVCTPRWPLQYDDKNASHIDAAALTVAVLRDQLVAMAEAEISEVTKAEAGEFQSLSIADRKQRIAELEAEYLAQEHVEGALLDVIGESARARHDMNVAAFLQVEVDPSPAEKQEREEEPEYTDEEIARDVKRIRLRSRSRTRLSEERRARDEIARARSVKPLDDAEESNFG